MTSGHGPASTGEKLFMIVTPFAPRFSFKKVKVEEDERSPLLPETRRLGKLLSSPNVPGPRFSPAGEPDTGWPEKHPGKWDLLLPPGHNLDSCSYCIKYLTFLWNLLFSVLGLLILAFGIWGLLDKESLVSERIVHLGSDPMLFFVLVGLAVSTVSLAGCMGALYENTCLLKFFTGGVVTFVILEILGGLVLYSLRHQIKGSLQNTMLVAVLRYQDDPDLRFIMDEVQMGLQCCGVESYQDWKMNMYFNCGVPASCCLNPLENGTITNSQCGFGALSMEEFAAQSIISLGGCAPQLSRWLHGHGGVLSAYFVFLILVEAGGFLLATKLLADLVTCGWRSGLDPGAELQADVIETGAQNRSPAGQGGRAGPAAELGFSEALPCGKGRLV
ncbi:Lipoma-preferred partner like protein [Platysternon megacephalum]|uniref:Lipoma-preferred partner like protein n=1 Tax=Platysternon megacephalum TaxID=55544 RepID=A0A4D9EE22_9SAUR|nr:Lipoma-preferred partner like protein [Platysternon megacephalum]